ncbi:MAG TPA: TetR/AcrR family transcriptional regulator [Acidimicrobiales bacterium]|nr:TetR/AcrR family transcriptional regulator [Acidimicrobiales bacterium]
MGETRTVRLPAARRRRQLLEVALRVFGDKGFEGTAMTELAESAGVTKPVLYQHFRSKRDLYLQLLGSVGASLVEAVTRAGAGASGPRQQVEAGFAAYFGFLDENRSAFRLLLGAVSGRDPQLSATAGRIEEDMAEAVAALIVGDLHDDQRVALAHALVGMAEAVSRRWLDGPEDWATPAVLARWVSDLAWSGLRGVTPVGPTEPGRSVVAGGSAPGHLRPGEVLVDPDVAGQAEDALADDVALDLRGAALD